MTGIPPFYSLSLFLSPRWCFVPCFPVVLRRIYEVALSGRTPCCPSRHSPQRPNVYKGRGRALACQHKRISICPPPRPHTRPGHPGAPSRLYSIYTLVVYASVRS
ncbi:hypothetical protein J6590_006288 [Homalodisca vitripennis]|nr:hypothetical protein J6590_006288 [Homalodisca vitripennis]